MADPLVIAVFGVEGPQGAAVARALARDPNIRVRAVVGQASADSQSVNSNTDYYPCNLNDVTSIVAALDGVYGCFIVTYSYLSDPSCKENELRQGHLIADACAMSKVRHVVYSTQLHAKRMLGLEVRQLDAKAEIEDCLNKKRLPLTFVMVPCCYEDFLGVFKPYQVDFEEYRISLPIGQAPLDMICRDDIGDVVHKIFLNRDSFINKTVSMCGDKITMKEVAATLTKHLRPKVVKEKQISINDYKQLEVSGARDWANMFYFFSRVDQRYNVAATRKINPNLRSFEDWVSENVDQFRTVL